MESDYKKLVFAVREMRKYQKLYFGSGRSSFCLKEAKKWEIKVDEILQKFPSEIKYIQQKINL